MIRHSCTSQNAHGHIPALSQWQCHANALVQCQGRAREGRYWHGGVGGSLGPSWPVPLPDSGRLSGNPLGSLQLASCQPPATRVGRKMDLSLEYVPACNHTAPPTPLLQRGVSGSELDRNLACLPPCLLV